MFKTPTYQKFSTFIALPLLVAGFFLLTLPALVSADPVPSCNPPAVLTPSKNGGAPYCKCPSKVVVVTDTGSSCASKCPKGTVATSLHNQTYCNQAVDSGSTTSGDNGGSTQSQQPLGTHYCGDPNKDFVNTSIDLGCKGKGNPILDLAFAAIRFLSYGVGLVIVGSLTYAGIQYTGSRGDPNANAQAVKRIQANVTALLLFVFAYAIVNYIVPGQLLK